MRTQVTEYTTKQDNGKAGLQFCYIYMTDEGLPKGAVLNWRGYWYSSYTVKETNFLVIHKPHKTKKKAVKAMRKEAVGKGFDLTISDEYSDLPPSITKLEVVEWLNFVSRL